jgi:hypothetical protein
MAAHPRTVKRFVIPFFMAKISLMPTKLQSIALFGKGDKKTKARLSIDAQTGFCFEWENDLPYFIHAL